MTSQYRRGADFERKCIVALKAQGAIYVVRAAGSHGPADLIAFYEVTLGSLYFIGGEGGRERCSYSERAPQFVQAKRDGRMSKADRWALCELAAQCGAVPVLAKAGPRGTPVVFTVLEWVGGEQAA